LEKVLVIDDERSVATLLKFNLGMAGYRVHQKGNLRAVDTHIYHLRKKLEVDREQSQFIKTVRGIGYTFEL
jgi:DNA-binding response OmpR family regulator